MPPIQLVGFPRSANTYLAQWCQFSELDLLESHHHWDYDLQARLLDEGAITYVLLRRPAEAIASCIVWNAHRGFNLDEEVQHVAHHFNRWRTFHRHARRRLLPRGAKVISFESIVDHSVAAVFASDGLTLRPGWSHAMFEQSQRSHLRDRSADPTANLGSAFTGQTKPQLRIPWRIMSTYRRLKRLADQTLDAAARSTAHCALQEAV